jgi:putative PIN family toxin of toxin-antitoxin system
VFAHGRLSWLLQHWQEGGCTPLISSATATELTRVFGYPKFRLSLDDRRELLAHYVPYCEIVEQVMGCPQTCRDEKDRVFLDLAQSGGAELLVSGDNDLLALAGQTTFHIETPEAYRLRIEEEHK